VINTIYRCFTGLALFGFAVACKTSEPQNVRGGQQWINLPPQTAARPIVGSYGFDLLGPVEAEACVDKNGPKYFVTMGPQRIGSMLSAVSGTQAEAAAVYKALKGLKDADLIIVTRAVTQLKGNKECAQIRGRALRLKKAEPRESESEEEDEVKATSPVNQPETDSNFEGNRTQKSEKNKRNRKKSRKGKRRKTKK
jgi:hypothetical protein